MGRDALPSVRAFYGPTHRSLSSISAFQIALCLNLSLLQMHSKRFGLGINLIHQLKTKRW